MFWCLRTVSGCLQGAAKWALEYVGASMTTVLKTAYLVMLFAPSIILMSFHHYHSWNGGQKINKIFI